jgi:hypothetical protein
MQRTLQRDDAARLTQGSDEKIKRRKLGEGEGQGLGKDAAGHKADSSDSDSDDDCGGDLAADGNWEEFDAIPAQSVDVRGRRTRLQSLGFVCVHRKCSESPGWPGRTCVQSPRT